MTIGIALLAAIITVETTLTDGTKTVETVDVPKADGTVRFVWPKEKIPANVKSVRVLPDFAKARYGEDGWLMAADGTRGFFVSRESNIRKLWRASHQITPLYGMKPPRTTFVALATGMKYHAGVLYVASNGWYSVTFDFHEDMYDVYEDISVLYRVFDDPKADYNDMAHWYRDYQRTNGRLTPLNERAAAHPLLAYAVQCPEVRIRQAWKPVPATVNRQVPENEPKITPYVTFKRVTELANRVHAAGVKGAEFCVNYCAEAKTVDGVTIPAMDYVVVR